ncbi:GspH/FimT family pseudopilin [Stutzerimonas kirkiae]|uniref:GspH/FimT family pseudopilin n=1 Tax=Stutzerimonas kirkiae TaxID=2211392 RepID=UPI001F613072|nr:GspH/FimT family pseudopilin [Stutzerimonas kirkiae]
MIRPKRMQHERQSAFTRERQLAFSLGELLLVTALLGILIGLGAQPLAQMVTQQRQQALLGQLRNSLQHARAQALLLGESVEICGSAQATNCNDDWSSGWRLHRPGRDQALQHHRLAHGEHLHWSGFTQRIRFLPNGTSPSGNGRFYQCRGERLAWQLVLNRQGRLKTTTHKENAARDALCRSKSSHTPET